jgi:hypothetical protein
MCWCAGEKAERGRTRVFAREKPGRSGIGGCWQTRVGWDDYELGLGSESSHDYAMGAGRYAACSAPFTGHAIGLSCDGVSTILDDAYPQSFHVFMTDYK